MDEAEARKYMELAVEVMRQSIPEPRDDGKATPSVGAVLVLPGDGGDQIITAARGEMRHGDHAEFTVLERKCRDRDVSGGVLFSTLEPCAPGARQPPKTGCAERIVNARIAKVWIGKEDPDPTVARKGFAYLREKGVDVQIFPADLQDQIAATNEEFFRQALERAAAYAERGLEEVVLSSLDEADPLLSLADLSETALEEYRRALGLEGDAELQHALRLEGLLVEEDGKLRPSGFCTLLFGKNPRARYPQAGVIGTIEYADGGEETREFAGPLVEIPVEVEEWLRSKLPNLIDRDRMKRSAGENLPLRPIREALVNALIHRDYDIDGAKVQLKVTPDGFSIGSPGEPVDPITREQLASFTAPTLSRNPKLHHVFQQMELAEEAGRGMKTMRELRAEARGVVPTMAFDDPYIVLTIHTSAESAATEVAQTDVANLLSSDELEGWQFLLSRGAVARSEYATERGVSAATAARQLARFVELGLASREGQGRATRYVARSSA